MNFLFMFCVEHYKLGEKIALKQTPGFLEFLSVCAISLTGNNNQMSS